MWLYYNMVSRVEFNSILDYLTKQNTEIQKKKEGYDSSVDEMTRNGIKPAFLKIIESYLKENYKEANKLSLVHFNKTFADLQREITELKHVETGCIMGGRVELLKKLLS